MVNLELHNVCSVLTHTYSKISFNLSIFLYIISFTQRFHTRIRYIRICIFILSICVESVHCELHFFPTCLILLSFLKCRSRSYSEAPVYILNVCHILYICISTMNLWKEKITSKQGLKIYKLFATL